MRGLKRSGEQQRPPAPSPTARAFRWPTFLPSGRLNPANKKSGNPPKRWARHAPLPDLLRRGY
jgi:hypothetical protein